MRSHILLPLLLSGLLYGCQSQVSQAEKVNAAISESCLSPIEASYHSVLNDSNQGWSECFNHGQQGLIDSVLVRVGQLADADNIESQQLDQLLYYLRAHSYYYKTSQLTPHQWQLVATALDKVANMTELAQPSQASARIREHLLVGLYQFSTDKKLSLAPSFAAKVVTNILKTQDSIINKQATKNLAAQYQQLELYRAIGFLSYKARRNNNLKQALLAPELTLSAQLLKHIELLTTNDWQLQNALWALASVHYIAAEAEQTAIDAEVSRIIFENDNLSLTEQQQLFSQHYLVNSFRYHEQCQQAFSGKCLIADIDQFLPINHVCSDTLFIRANKLSALQLDQACQQLTSQEAFFHQTVNTGYQPVSNDLNSKLQVVIFDNYSQYNRWGQLYFNIGTDNGGMYIEGKPEQQGNQATFYSFQAFWQQPRFSVWNLNHEYVHYLDGRYVKYGTYGHFPSHLVWWSEGLAEYVALQQNNNGAFALLNDTPEQQWPTLSKIFSTSYADGLDLVYRWSYQAIRFIFETQAEQGQLLAQALKQDNFELYQSRLKALAAKQQSAFLAWQKAHKPAKSTPQLSPKVKRYRPSPLYRYLYRDYLRPSHLPINRQHKHFSNWG